MGQCCLAALPHCRIASLHRQELDRWPPSSKRSCSLPMCATRFAASGAARASRPSPSSVWRSASALNTTIFSIVDGVLLKPYPYPDPDRILVVGDAEPEDGRRRPACRISTCATRPGGRRRRSRRSPRASGRSLTIVRRQRGARAVSGRRASRGICSRCSARRRFSGQGFTAEQDRVGGGGVVLLSHDLWTRALPVRPQRDRPDDSRQRTAAHGHRRDAAGLRVSEPAAAVGAADAARGERPRASFRNLFTFGRLKPGVTVEQATQKLDALFGAARAAVRRRRTKAGPRGCETLREEFLPPEVPLVIAIMMGSVTLVLFIACSNVANLLRRARDRTAPRDFGARRARRRARPHRPAAADRERHAQRAEPAARPRARRGRARG